MNWFSKLLTGIAVSVSAYLPVSAQEISITAKNPITTIDGNTSTYRAAGVIGGAGVEELSKELGADRSIYGRAGEALAQTTLDSFLGVLSHELGHYHEAGELDDLLDGVSVSRTIRLHPFKYGLFWGGSTPVNYTAVFPAMPPAESDKIKIFAAGHNQDYFNALRVWKETRSRARLNDSTGLLVTQCSELFGNINSDSDVSRYVRSVNDAGFSLEDGQVTRNSARLNILNVSLFDALYSVGDFIVAGNREHRPTRFVAGEWTVYPPLFSHFLTARGEFANGALFIDGPVDVEISAGRDLDFTQRRADVDRWRVGGKIYVPVGDVIVAPFAYGNSRSSWAGKGIYCGVDARVPLSEKVSVDANLAYQSNDIIENVLKGEPRVTLEAGVRIHF